MMLLQWGVPVDKEVPWGYSFSYPYHLAAAACSSKFKSSPRFDIVLYNIHQSFFPSPYNLAHTDHSCPISCCIDNLLCQGGPTNHNVLLLLLFT